MTRASDIANIIKQPFTTTLGTSNYRAGVNSGDSIASGGNYNVIIGDDAGTAITTGDNNIAIGFEALKTEDAHGYNTAIGYRALKTQDAGAEGYNTAIGADAGTAVTTGTTNSFLGAYAGEAMTTGGSSTALGYESLHASQDGAGNSVVGYRAGYSLTSGSRNMALGEQSLRGATTGDDNVGIGYQSYFATCTGSDNIGIGYRAFFSATSAGSNIAIGYQGMNDLLSGSQNTAVGYRALPHVSTGDNNTGIGFQVGDGAAGTALTTGAGNVLMGYRCDANAADTSYSIVIGYSSTSKGSSTGFISPNDGAVYQGNNASAWAQTSDRRIKKNIVDNTVGLDVVNQVQVRNFEYRTKDEITEIPSHAAINKQGVQLGVIAQEIQPVLPDMVTEESTGVLSVNADNMTWYLVNAVKELSAKNDALEARIAELEEN